MQIGSLIECINDHFPIKPKSRNVNLPKKGKIYTVIGICKKHRGIGVYIEECPESIIVKYDSGKIQLEKCPFLVSRFREVLPPVSIKNQVEETLKDIV